MNLRDLDLKSVYDSSAGSIVKDFLVPALGSSLYYDRGVGYFSSGWLREAAAGMAEFAANGGRARWITSPILSEQDWEAIVRGEALRSNEYLKNLLKAQIKDIEEALDEDKLTIISWMVADEILTFKIALPTGRLEGGDFHDKFGIFQDAVGNRICFSGSYNDSVKGSFNYESIKVFASWDHSLRAFVDIDSRRFERLWSNSDLNVRVYEVPDAIKGKIIRFKKDRDRPYRAALAADSKKRPRTPRFILPKDYQHEAVKAWFKNGCHGIFDMATGTGKTIAALLCLIELLQTQNELLVIITCPFVHLVDQWIEECHKFNLETIACYENSAKWYPALKDRLQKMEMRKHIGMEGSSVLVAVISNDSFVDVKFQGLVQEFDLPMMFIADEVHHFGSPTRLAKLPDKVQFRLGLSATPERWYDEEGTRGISGYFGGTVFTLDLGEAIYEHEALSRYLYQIHTVELSPGEFEKYKAISIQIARMLGNEKKTEAIDRPNGALGHLLRERTGILNNAAAKLPLLNRLLGEQADLGYTLIYTSPEQIASVNSILADMNVIFHQITYRESAKERAEIIRGFEDGTYKVMTAIRCLDEGTDIPGIKTAFLLASTGNPREYIQRRGRILRKAPNKKIANIIDFVALPTATPGRLDEDNLWVEKSILRREFFRLHYFAKWAENKHEALLAVYDLARSYGIHDTLLGGEDGHREPA
jgi:superfamily II DNA or RNA helicase